MAIRILIHIYLLCAVIVIGNAQSMYRGENIDLVGTITHTNVLKSQIWHQPSTGKEYALVCTPSKIYIYDISSSLLPSVSFTLPYYYLSTLPGFLVHNDHLYVNNLWMDADVFDLNHLPDSVSQIGVVSGMQVNIFSSTPYKNQLFTVKSGALYRFDLSNPVNPYLTDSMRTDLPHLLGIKNFEIQDNVITASFGSKGVYVLKFSDHKFSIIDSMTHFFPDLISCYGVVSSANHQSIVALYSPVTLDAKMFVSSNNSRYQEAYGFRPLPSNYPVKGQFLFDKWLAVSSEEDGISLYKLKSGQTPLKTGYFNSRQKLPGLNLTGISEVHYGLPSGRIVATDRSKGILILDPRNAMKESSIKEEELHDYNLNVFPNPCIGHVNLRLKRDHPCALSIVDILGRKIFEKTYSDDIKDILELSQFAEGIYTIRIDGNEGQLTRKLILQH